MLGKNLLPLFVIEGSMAAAEFREKLPDTAFEFIGLYCLQFGSLLVDMRRPRVVAHTAYIDVMPQNQLLHGSQNLGALIWTERDVGVVALHHERMWRDQLHLRI